MEKRKIFEKNAKPRGNGQKKSEWGERTVEITDVRIRYLHDGTKMKAVASITIDNALAIHDIKIIESSEKVFLAMPSRRLSDGTYRDLVHPINAQVREMLQERILAMYKEVPPMP